MTVEAISRSGLFGLTEHREIVPQGTSYSFILPRGIFERKIIVKSADEIKLLHIYINGSGLRVKNLNKEEINKANLIVPRKNEKPISLRWKK